MGEQQREFSDLLDEVYTTCWVSLTDVEEEKRLDPTLYSY